MSLQVAFNGMIQAPSSGGAVTIYNRRPSKVEYDAYREAEPNQYALKKEFLPLRSVTIEPEAGDIYLFNASLPHEVSETAGDTRYTISGFIGVDNQRKIWLFS